MTFSKAIHTLSVCSILLVTALTLCPGIRSDKLQWPTQVPSTPASGLVILQADGATPLPPPPPQKQPFSSFTLA